MSLIFSLFNVGGTSKTQETRHQASDDEAELVFPTPPCSSDNNLDPNQKETTLKKNALFLHSIAQLQSIPECHRNDLNETIHNTALSAIQHVEDFVIDNCHGPWNHEKMLKKAVKCIVGLFEIKDNGDWRSLLEACERLAGRLLESLVEHDGLNNVSIFPCCYVYNKESLFLDKFMT